MRTIVQTSYLRLLRVQGWYAFGFLPITVLALPGAFEEGRFLVVTTLLTALAGIGSLKLALPGQTPRWLTHPTSAFHGLSGVLLWAVLLGLFLATTMGTLILLGLPVLLTETLFLAGAAVHVMFCGVSGAMVLALGLWPEGAGVRRTAETVVA